MIDLVTINNLDSSKIFTYVVILIIFLFIFSKLSIGLNIFLGIILAIALMLYLYQTDQADIGNKNNLHKEKLQNIKPQPKSFGPYDDLVDFFFSIQELYYYNPPAYEEAVDNTDSFIVLYEQVLDGPQLAGLNYELAEKKKLNAVNAIQSLIFKIPTNKLVIHKLNNADRILDEILNKYLSTIYTTHYFNVLKYSYNNQSKIIDLGPKAASYYDFDQRQDKTYNYIRSNKYTYEIF